MNHIMAIFKKQLKDTCKNKEIFIQFVMFPLLSIFMNRSMQIEGMQKNFFIQLFAVMYAGMAPLVSMAAIIAEEKEKNTLRVLMMSVREYEYLLGVGSYVWIFCMLGSLMMCIEGGYGLGEGLIFMVIMAIGIMASLLIGAAIGIWSKNQMSASSLSVPLMLLFSFLPMLSVFNETAHRIAGFTYTEQLRRMIAQLSEFQLDFQGLLIIAVNMMIAFLCFSAAYKRKGIA